MITSLNRRVIVFSFILMFSKGICIAQSDSHIDISAYKVSVADSDLIALLDTMYSRVDKCGMDMSSLFFYILEDYFDGGNRFLGMVLPYVASSYQEKMWHNDVSKEGDVSYWERYYFYHKEVLCICNANHENIFKEISKSSDVLSLPSNTPQDDLFYLEVVPVAHGNCLKYYVYTYCD